MFDLDAEEAPGEYMILSIIIPFYNNGLTLTATLRSIENAVNLCPNAKLELVLIDNNSSDDSSRIAKEFCAERNYAIIFSEERQGVSFARNRGLKESSGDYFAFVDADDQLSPNYINLLLRGISLGADLLFIPVGQDQVYASPEIVTQKTFLRKVLKGWWCWSFVAKRHCFDGLSFDGDCLEDFGFFPSVISRAKCIVALPYGTYKYFDNPNGLSSIPHEKRMQWLEFQYKKLFMQQNILDPEVWQAVQNSYLQSKMQYARQLGCIPLLRWPQMLKALILSCRYGHSLNILRLIAGAYRQRWRELLSSRVRM